MKRNPNAKCGTCPYWLLSIPEDNIGECHRDNPHAVDPYRRWETTNSKEWCGQHPDFWEAEAAKVSITYADGHTECVAATADCKPPTLDDVLAAYRTAVEMAQCYTGRICDRCANARTVACGRCLVGWKLQFQPKEAAQ